MLPHPTSNDFPAAMKARREQLGLSRAELAQRAKIHSVMPRRYEEPDCGEFARPRHVTYLAICKALDCVPEQQEEDGVLLKNASLEQIIAEVRSRGAALTIHYS